MMIDLNANSKIKPESFELQFVSISRDETLSEDLAEGNQNPTSFSSSSTACWQMYNTLGGVLTLLFHFFQNQTS
jgi:hypothetical protein